MHLLPSTQDRLKALLHYEPETGVFTWRVSRGRQAAGSRAGALRPDGYRQIRFEGKYELEHRLAWLYANGRMPADETDHRYHARADNRIAALREVTTAQNQQNRARRPRGITFHRRSGLWNARIEVGCKCISLGYYKTEAVALEVAAAARAQQHPYSQGAFQ